MTEAHRGSRRAGRAKGGFPGSRREESSGQPQGAWPVLPYSEPSWLVVIPPRGRKAWAYGTAGSRRWDRGRTSHLSTRASSGRLFQLPARAGDPSSPGTGAGPSWRPSALLIPSPLAKGTERSCGPAKLSGELGDAAANAQRGVNYLNICFPHGY